MNSEINCVFCKIAKLQIDAELLYSDEFCFVVNDINPVSPVHLLIIPNFHYRNLQEIIKDFPKLFEQLIEISYQLSQDFGVAETGFRLVINQGDDAGQEIQHFHMHLLGGRKLDFPSV